VSVLIVYSPVGWAGFIWDDDFYVTGNPTLTGLRGLGAIWSTTAADICPLTMTTFWIETQLWGFNPVGFHLVNVVIHGANAIVLWRLLRALEIPGAWIGAALWALHPVLVESVAWISELKNTQSTFFYLLALLFFTRWLRDNRRVHYALTLLFTAMAMASKSSTMMLPLVLALCAWWIDGRWQWRRAVEVAPTLLFSVAAGLLSVWTQGIHRHVEWTPRSLPERLATAGDAIWFYLGKLVDPYPLFTIYPRWQIDTSNPLQWLPLLALVALLVVFWVQRERWGRPWFFTLIYFIAALLPVLGLVEHGFLRYSFVGDHFQNLAAMAPLAIAGAGLSIFFSRLGPERAWMKFAAVTLILGILGLMTWSQTWIYRNSTTLWAYTLRWDPNSWGAHGNLGVDFYRQGNADAALAEFRTALSLNPRYSNIYYNVGVIQSDKGSYDDAIDNFHHALDLIPDDEGSHYELGLALSKKGDLAAAIDEFHHALALDPSDAKAHFEYAQVLSRQNRFDEAIPEFQKALGYDSTMASAHLDLGVVLAQLNRYDEAIDQFQQAIKLEPGAAKDRDNLGLALSDAGRASEALDAFASAVQLDPHDMAIRFHFALALARAGRLDEAVAQFQEIAKARPNDASARNNLGGALLQAGRVGESITEFQEALRLQPGYPDAQKNLSRAQSMAHQPAAR
jgi:tetratricopeptide (TPR) repeat protein